MSEIDFLPTETLDEKLHFYTGRRILIKLRDGGRVEAKAGYYCEDMDVDREEPDEEFLGWGVMLKDVVMNGEKLPRGIALAFADIVGFLPLEGENSEEEMKKLFDSDKEGV